VILISGRPLVVTKQLGLTDALVAAWLPGTEGQGIADVLFGDAPLFPCGYGLSASEPSPATPDCSAK
jgi:hypothetical protein